MSQDNDVLEYALQINILFSKIQQSKSLTCPELPSVPAVSAIASSKVCMTGLYRVSESSERKQGTTDLLGCDVDFI